MQEAVSRWSVEDAPSSGRNDREKTGTAVIELMAPHDGPWPKADVAESRAGRQLRGSLAGQRLVRSGKSTDGT